MCCFADDYQRSVIGDPVVDVVMCSDRDTDGFASFVHVGAKPGDFDMGTFKLNKRFGPGHTLRLVRSKCLGRLLKARLRSFQSHCRVHRIVGRFRSSYADW